MSLHYVFLDQHVLSLSIKMAAQVLKSVTTNLSALPVLQNIIPV